MKDPELLELLCRREPSALEVLMSRYGPLLRYVIRAILPDPRDQEECLADLAVLLWERISSYDPEKGELAPWLAALARNTALNRARSLRRSGQSQPLLDTMADPVPGPEQQVLQQETVQGILVAVEQFSPTDRLLFYRKYYYMQSTAQMAAELGLSPRAVEGRLYRLRNKLKEMLGGEWNG